ncbi:hypothetical protein EB118_09275 [bacterium]|nr:hypothetical protein [bacterium]
MPPCECRIPRPGGNCTGQVSRSPAGPGRRRHLRCRLDLFDGRDPQGDGAQEAHRLLLRRGELDSVPPDAFLILGDIAQQGLCLLEEARLVPLAPHGDLDGVLLGNSPLAAERAAETVDVTGVVAEGLETVGLAAPLGQVLAEEAHLHLAVVRLDPVSDDPVVALLEPTLGSGGVLLAEVLEDELLFGAECDCHCVFPSYLISVTQVGGLCTGRSGSILEGSVRLRLPGLNALGDGGAEGEHLEHCPDRARIA